MPVQIRPEGPFQARILIVGEAPGADEEAKGVPFQGYSGMELNKMLGEVGISRSECFLTYVCRERPLGNDVTALIAKSKKEITKDHTLLRDKYVKRPIIEGYNLLIKEIQTVRPNIIIALGNLPLWALTGLWGILKQRGSMLYENISGLNCKLIPTYQPAAVLRQWDWRAITVTDLRRAARFRTGQSYPTPMWNFLIRPSLREALVPIQKLIEKVQIEVVRVSLDLETKHGHIDCCGLSWNLTEAVCIPLLSWSNPQGYWSEDEEAILVYNLYKLLTHTNCYVVGQNILYDAQYIHKYWHFIPNVKQDSMISHHVAFCGLKKSLDFQASMYCDFYRQWKPDKESWKEGG